MSRSAISVGIAIAVAVSFLFVGVGAVAADHGETNAVGAEGNCDDANDNGGSGSIGVSEDGDVDDTGPDEIQSTVEGLAFFAEQKNDNPDRADTCDGGEDEADNDDNGYDYLTVYAGPVQYCYSQDNSNDNGGQQCHD